MFCPICNNAFKNKVGKYYGSQIVICNACNVFFYEETLKRRIKERPFLLRYYKCLQIGMNPNRIGKGKKRICNNKYQKNDKKLLILIHVLTNELKNM